MRSDPHPDDFMPGADHDPELLHFEAFETLLHQKTWAELHPQERSLALLFVADETDYTDQRNFALRSTGAFAAERLAGPDPAEPDEVLLRNLHEAVQRNAPAAGGGGIARPTLWARMSAVRIPVYQAAAVVALLIGAWWVLPRWQKSADLNKEIVAAGPDTLPSEGNFQQQPEKANPTNITDAQGEEDQAPPPPSNAAPTQANALRLFSPAPQEESEEAKDVKEPQYSDYKPRQDYWNLKENYQTNLAADADAEPPAESYTATIESEEDRDDVDDMAVLRADWASEKAVKADYAAPQPTQPGNAFLDMGAAQMTDPSLSATVLQEIKAAGIQPTTPTAPGYPSAPAVIKATEQLDKAIKPQYKSANVPQVPAATAPVQQSGQNVGNLILQLPKGQNANQTNGILNAIDK